MTNGKESLFDTADPPPFHSGEVTRQHHGSDIDVSVQGTLGNEPRPEHASTVGGYHSTGLLNSDDIFLEEGGSRSGSCIGKSEEPLGDVHEPGTGVTHAGTDIGRYRDTKGSPGMSESRVRKRWRPGDDLSDRSHNWEDEGKGRIARAENLGRRRWRG